MSAAAVVESNPLPRIHRKPKAKSSSREQQHLERLLEEARSIYAVSQLAQNIDKSLASTLKIAKTPITRIISLGLGSLFIARGQARRLKQLTILLAIRDSLQRILNRSIELFAQDPAFTRADEAYLATHGIRILRTPSGANLGEAAPLIDGASLIYLPFLTLEAYEQLLLHSASPAQYLIGDDFNALLNKWPKHSAERSQVDRVMKSALSRYRRKAISGEGFWMESDQSFPMALYAVQNRMQERAKI